MGKLSDYQQSLVTENIKLAYFIKNKWIKKLVKCSLDENDLESSCFFGLVKAARSYDGTKNVKFATYATKCMDNEVLMAVRQTKKKVIVISLNDKLTNDYETDLEIKDIISSVGIEEEVISKIYIADRLSLIKNDRDKLILKLLKDGKSQKTIGNQLSISQSYVSRLRRKLEKLLVEGKYR